MDDLTTITTEALTDLRANVAAEQERRDRLAQAPAQVAETARRYTEDGGDVADLIACITPTE